MTERRMQPQGSSESDIAGLESSLMRFASRGPAPVHLWNPEHCGEIGLSIGADGTWYYRNSPIGRSALVRLFSTVLRKDSDGRHYLVTPVEKIAIDVADAPFMAVELSVSDEGAGQSLTFRTNCDDVVTVDGEHPLRFVRDPGTQGIKPYVLVRGALEALVTRALMYDLVELGEREQVGSVDMFGVRSGGRFFAIAPSAELGLS